MKLILILIQIVAVILLVLNYFKAIINNYIPVICYFAIFTSLLITLIMYKKEKKNI